MILNLLTKKVDLIFFSQFYSSHKPCTRLARCLNNAFVLMPVILSFTSFFTRMFNPPDLVLSQARTFTFSIAFCQTRFFFSFLVDFFFRSKKLSAYHLITFRIRTLIANVRFIMRFVKKNLIFFGARWLEWSLCSKKISSIILWKTAINHNNDAYLITNYGME